MTGAPGWAASDSRQMIMPKLVATEGPDQFKEWPIVEGIVPVGRRPTNYVVLADPAVSRQHFSIRCVDGQASIINHSASQGTYVNGIRVDGEVALNDTDQIRIGDTTLVFYAEQKGGASSFSMDDSDSGVIPGVRLPQDRAPLSGPSGAVAAMGRQDQFAAVCDPNEASLVGLAGQAATGAEGLKLQEQMRLIHEIGQQLVAELDLKTLFATILEKVFTLVTVDTGHVLLFDPKARRVETVAVRNRDGSTTQNEHMPSRSLVLFAVRNHKAVLSANTQEDERFSEQMSIISRGIQSAMCVPMIYQDETLGVIYADNYEAGYTFTQADLNLLTIVANQAAIAVRNAKLCRQIVAEETKRNNLSRYLAPQLVDEVAQEDAKLSLGGRLVNAAIMESDIRGFTSMSENMPPQDVVSLLNIYFTEMTEIVFETRGTLDKYIGDALLAAWGSPVPDPQASINALKAAVLMIKRLPEIKFPGSNETPFQIGIGLHYGEVLHGNLGSEKIMQYTVIGDTVNTAARLCDRAARGEILMTKAFLDSLGREVPVTELEPMHFKGKAEPMRVFRFAGAPQGAAQTTPTPPPNRQPGADETGPARTAAETGTAQAADETGPAHAGAAPPNDGNGAAQPVEADGRGAQANQSAQAADESQPAQTMPPHKPSA